MLDISKQEIKLFYCYAHEDKTWRDELQKHMRGLRRLYPLREWHDREILPGEEWEKAIDTNLNSAHLILLLVSPDFMNSDYCYSKEMQRALERHEEGTCKVIPIILRPTYLEAAPFHKLQMLPTDAKPITRWPDRDEAFHDVVREISLVLKDLLISLKTQKDWLDEGISLRDQKRYDEALEAFEQALRRDPKYLEVYQQKGLILLELAHYDEALEAFEQALHLNPSLAPLYVAQGQTLNALEHYEEALRAFEQAIHLDLNLAEAYIGRDKALQNLGVSRIAQEQLESQLNEAHQQLTEQQKQSRRLESQLRETQQQKDRVLEQLSIAQKRTEQLEERERTKSFTAEELILPALSVEQFTGRIIGLAIATRSDPGIKGKYKPNEDSLFAAHGERNYSSHPQQFGLFVVADGMSEHANGQDASRLAIQTIVDRVMPQLSENEHFTDDALVQLLVDGVKEANLSVHQRNMEHRADMGTTMTAALVAGSMAYVANVGDSRTYLYRKPGGLKKITNDHSIVASLVEAGIIKPDEIYTHPKLNQIYRSLGEKPVIDVDSFKVSLQPGDKLLLCSDGLWNMMRDPTIEQVLSTVTDPSQTSDALIGAALAGGGEGNVSVIVVYIYEATQLTGMTGIQLLARPDAPQYPPS